MDARAWNNPGAIVDLGCWPWDWSAAFVGKKRVVGVDPFADLIPGVELFQGVVGHACGTALISQSADRSSVFAEGSKSVPMLSWKKFRNDFHLGQIAVLKINIEGSEYALLHSMDEDDFADIDQIAVSFHDFLWPTRAKATQAALTYLKSLGYSIVPTNSAWRWYLCLK